MLQSRNQVFMRIQQQQFHPPKDNQILFYDKIFIDILKQIFGLFFYFYYSTYLNTRLVRISNGK